MNMITILRPSKFNVFLHAYFLQCSVNHNGRLCVEKTELIELIFLIIYNILFTKVAILQ